EAGVQKQVRKVLVSEKADRVYLTVSSASGSIQPIAVGTEEDCAAIIKGCKQALAVIKKRKPR
ncbi:hypothetical protein, partial [Salmonella enterica]|uniref:hypothetical protein n=1 Tax=Salmonella enterica TaxID=28901 RepID=UPI0039E732D7